MTSGVHGMGVEPRVDDCDCHVCRPDPTYEAHDQSVLDTVVQHGWQVLLVGSGACEHCDEEGHDHGPEETGPAFAYTVGLGHRADHPELVISGLDPHLMHRVLNGLAQRVLAGRRFDHGDVVEDVLGRVPVVLARASEQAREEVVTWSGWFHRRPADALVVVWPSTSAVFAWQPGAPPELDERQPPTWREHLDPVGPLAPDPEWPFPVPPDLRALTCTHVIEDAEAILWVARESDPSRREDWSFHCGARSHADDDIVVTHLAHLVRGAPSTRAVADLPLDWAAQRADADHEWETHAL